MLYSQFDSIEMVRRCFVAEASQNATPTILFRKQQRRQLMFLLILITTASWLRGVTPAVEFVLPEESPFAANEGHLKMGWEASGSPELPAGWSFRLEQSPDPEFAQGRVLYRGRDGGTFASGLPAGETYFRIRAEQDDKEAGSGPWSKTVTVTVNFPAPWLVAVLVAFGSLLGLVLLGTILLGSRRAYRERKETEDSRA